MQYRGYEIQIAEYGCIVRDNRGEYLTSVDNETEAKDYINELNTSDEKVSYNKKDWYTQFCKYCHKLPGRCYIENKLATTNQNALNNIIKSFEKTTNTKVHYHNTFIDGEHFYIVDQITVD